jgi:DUF1009 family protein
MNKENNFIKRLNYESDLINLKNNINLNLSDFNNIEKTKMQKLNIEKNALINAINRNKKLLSNIKSCYAKYNFKLLNKKAILKDLNNNTNKLKKVKNTLKQLNNIKK